MPHLIHIDRIRTREFLSVLCNKYEKRRWLMIGIYALLAACRPRPMTSHELGVCLYGDDPDGGPLYLNSSIQVTICKMRKMGVPIRTSSNRGYYLPLPAEAPARSPIRTASAPANNRSPQIDRDGTGSASAARSQLASTE